MRDDLPSPAKSESFTMAADLKKPSYSFQQSKIAEPVNERTIMSDNEAFQAFLSKQDDDGSDY